MRRVCEACGNEIDNDFNYCRECGEIVEPLEEDEERADLIYEYEIKIAKAKRNNDTEAQYYYQDKLDELLREDDRRAL